MTSAQVVVVGGGAAGMIAAMRAAQSGADTLLLEKKARLGTKILVSGGGKCNVTHDGEMETIRAKFRTNEGRFLRPSFYKYTNTDFTDLLTERGLQLYTRPDGRIFPVPPFDAKDVANAIERAVREAGARVRLKCPVVKVQTGEANRDGHNRAVTGVELESGEIIETRHLVIAVGGSSYPATGTTGDGWRWLASLGHTIVPLRAALAPLYLDPTPPEEWSGVALRDCVLRARGQSADGRPGRERMRWRGDMLWTHKGVSGPTALGVSREVAELIPENSWVEADVAPDEAHDALNARIVAYGRANPKRTVLSFVEELVPARLALPLLQACSVSPETKWAYLSQKERARLVATLKAWPLGRVRHVPLERGEVVAGGVSLDEVDAQTMRSRKLGGLYLCGEVLDIAGPVGGYNLQAAWSTGFVAGETAARDAQSVKIATATGAGALMAAV